MICAVHCAPSCRAAATTTKSSGCVSGKKPRGIDQVYNHDEQWIIRKMAFEAAHDYIAELVGAKRAGKVVRLQRTNPLDPIKAELLGRLREHYAAETA